MKPRGSCGRKVRHKSKGAAEAHLRALERQGITSKVAYPCYWCKGWHVGRPRRQRR